MSRPPLHTQPMHLITHTEIPSSPVLGAHALLSNTHSRKPAPNAHIPVPPPQVPTRYRRASQLRLGPLVLSDPVMLEMSISNIVGQFHDNVIGIAGEGGGRLNQGW